MLTHLRPALVLTLTFTALTGLAYPLAVTGIAQALRPEQANGSPVVTQAGIVGSALIGQAFSSERYFHGRPSATTAPDLQDATKSIDSPYNAGSSTGSNLGPSSKTLLDAVRARAESLGEGQLPADLVTASGSGLDPDITPAAALVQIARVAKVRGLPEERLRELVRNQTAGRMLGLLGEPRVNVLALNLALDRVTP